MPPQTKTSRPAKPVAPAKTGSAAKAVKSGKHVFLMPDPCAIFDETLYYDHLLIRFLATQGRELVFLERPASHHCLLRQDCHFFSNQ